MEKLTEPCSILVYDTKGENLVEFLTIGTPLACSGYGIQFDDCLDVGRYHDSEASSVEELIATNLQDYWKGIEKTKQELLSDGYYEKTQDLAVQYQTYAKEYFEEEERMTGHYKKFSKSEIAKRFNDFFRCHEGLQEGFKFHLDSRFQLASYDKKYLLNGKEETVVSVKENKIFTKEEFRQAVEENARNTMKSYRDNVEWMFRNAEEDYKDLKEKVHALLKEHPRVGLIGYQAEGNVKQIENLSIDDFTLMDYLKVKPKSLYWFTH